MRFVLPVRVTRRPAGSNLVTLDYTTAEAALEKKVVRLKPERICDVGCETPSINYDRLDETDRVLTVPNGEK